MQEKGYTHKTESVGVWVIDNIFLQFRARSPSRNELRGLESDTQEGDDVWVRQPFPLDDLGVDSLLVSSMMQLGKDNWVYNLSPLQNCSGVNH